MQRNIKVNQHAAAIHIAEVDDTGHISYPLCGTGNNNLLGMRTVRFHPVIVDEDTTCKRCIGINTAHAAQDKAITAVAEESAQIDAEIAATEAAWETRLPLADQLRALRNIRDFGAFANWVDIETANALAESGYIKLASGRAGYYVTRQGLDQLK